MIWRELKKDEIDLLKLAAGFETAFPSFFRDASNTWTQTEEEALGFYQRCDRLFGLFEDEFVGLVYFENVTPKVTNVHFDVKRGTDPRKIAPCIGEIRDLRFSEGIELGTAWVLKRNRGIQRLLEAIGFRRSGLDMKRGSSHGRVLRWAQMVVTPAMAGEA